MAPIRKSSSDSAPTRKSILKNPSQSKKLDTDSVFATTKRDKRRIKHAQLVSKVEKPSRKPRRRRPSKKLMTTLDALTDALPRVEQDNDRDIGSKQTKDQVNIIKRKSIRSRPGAMKRREKLDQGERDRFAKNLAQMAGTAAPGGSHHSASNTPKTEDRWEALRGFISQTIEKKPGLS